MFMFPPIELHTTVPWTAWSAPSIVTVVLPCADAAEDVSPLVSAFLSSDEQPDSPAMTIAAPPTATTNPRFTTVLLMCCRDPSRSADHPGQYGWRIQRGYGDLAKNLPMHLLIVIW